MSENESPVEWQRVADGVWCTALPADGVEGGTNVVLVAGTEGCVLVDTGATPEQGAALRASLTSVTDAPLSAVVLTHGHPDHAGGLPALDGVPVLGHKSLGELVTEPFSLVQARDLGGGVGIEAMVVGPAHTPGDVVVYVPHAHVLVTGDILTGSGLPTVGEDSSLRGWVKGFGVIAPLLVPGTILVPGHGPVSDRELFSRQAGELSDVYARCEQLLVRGVGTTDRALPLGEWPWDDETALRPALDAAFRDLHEAGKRPQLGLTSLRDSESAG